MNNPTSKKGKKKQEQRSANYGEIGKINKQKKKRKNSGNKAREWERGKEKKTVLILRCPEFSGAHYNVAHCSVQKIARKIEILFLVSHNAPRSGTRSNEPRIIIDTRGEIN